MGIRVHVVTAGLMLTDAISSMLEDSAGATLFNVSDETKFIAGNYLPVNGWPIIDDVIRFLIFQMSVLST